MTYQVNPQQALENAGRLIKEGAAHAVKIEGGVRSAAHIAAIASADIPVMGHIGSSQTIPVSVMDAARILPYDGG